ncbi:MAG: transposase [Hyphomicrobiales bacterium]|nr:transposase [Hyphomicrobiales bacterium]
MSPGLIRPIIASGGGYEIAFDALPKAARAELEKRDALARLPAPTSRQTPAVAETHLTQRQRDIMSARRAVCLEIDRLAIVCGCGVAGAVKALLADHRAGLLAPEVASAVRTANEKGRSLSERSLYRWLKAREDGGAAMAPRRSRQIADAPDWLDVFLSFYARPQKPDVSQAYAAWLKSLPAGTPAPSYAAVRRALSKLSHLERAHGREGKLALRARQAYVVRDFADLAPTTIYVADGTTFDAEVEHPIHGRPFKPEITIITDVATRRAVGWSAGLAESQLTVSDALARAAEQGIPALFYTDRGSGYRNFANDDQLVGLFRRLGTTPMRALPYNSQAKGVIENFQRRWIAVAKQFPTYTYKDMDKEAKQIAFKETRRELAFIGRSRLLPTWAEFIAAIETAVTDYNDKPHRSLPHYRDPLTGSKRRMTPNELWAQKVAAGAELIIPGEDERADLFRPYEVRRVRRCMIELGTNSYFSTQLDPFHGQDVMVGYDVRDAAQVWIRRIDMHQGERQPGALVCIAQFEGNKTRYIPVSAEQAALEKRAAGQRRRLADKLDRVEAQLRPAQILTLQPVAQTLLAASSPLVDGEIADGPELLEQVSRESAPEPSAPEGGRPNFSDDLEFARWLIDHPADATATDRELVVELLTGAASQKRLQLHGVDLDRLRTIAISEAA